MIVYDASGLIFTATAGSYVSSPQISHAIGTYTWDPATNTGVWDVSVPFGSPGYGLADLGSWLNPYANMLSTFSSTSFDSTSPTNSDTVQGDFSMTFASPLGNGTDAVTGTFSVQNDFAPYAYSGTISGYLAPAVAVPEPSASLLLLAGLLLVTAIRAMKRKGDFSRF